MIHPFFDINLTGNGVTMISKKENAVEFAKMVSFFVKLFGSCNMKQRADDATTIIVDNI